MQNIFQMSVTKLNEIFDNNLDDNYLIIDVREELELEIGIIENAYNIPLSMFDISYVTNLDKYSSTINIIFYCAIGKRSQTIINLIHADDTFSENKLYNLVGGIHEWAKKGYYIEKDI